MRCFILMFMIFWFHLATANAQGLFQYDRVDFFGKIETSQEVIQTETKPNPEPVIDEWAEPIISPSGKVSVYLPPKEVRDFLENPTPENAKAYLEWNSRRIKKFTLAHQLLAKEAAKLGIIKDVGDFKAKENYLVYFMLKSCSLCEKQAKVIEDIYVNHPEIKIEGFGTGFSDKELQEFSFPVRQDKGISQVFKIKFYPAILVFNKNKRRYFLSGYTDKDRILRLFE